MGDVLGGVCGETCVLVWGEGREMRECFGTRTDRFIIGSFMYVYRLCVLVSACVWGFP